MGLLRFLLAIDIVLIHLGGIPFGFVPMDGTVAITAFYIISGFYMALILNEKYNIKNNSYKLFLTNRFLRIYPLYWILLIIAVFTSLVFIANPQAHLLSPFINQYQVLHGLTLLKQIVIDLVRVILLVPNSAYFLPKNYNLDLIVIGPSWTLGLELIFYLIVPFIARRSLKQIVVITLICHFLRVITYHYFVILIGKNVYVNSFFFPAVVFYFVFGVLSYKLYAIYKKFNSSVVFSRLVLIFIVLYTIFYHFIPIDTRKIYYFSLFISIPIIFKQFNKNKFDKFVGDLSYPIYISHFVLINFSFLFLPKQYVNFSNIILLFLCILFAFILHKTIEVPIDRYRQARLLAKNKG
jgi:peptidoglycan/LPS O-acetylase OafA/YrhL